MKGRFASIARQAGLLLLLASSLCPVAFASDSPVVPCPLPGKGGETFLTLEAVPPPIFHQLQRRFGNGPGNGIDMEQRDSDWQETDVVLEGEPMHSFRRFIQAGHDGTRWYVWYELGGIGLSYQIAVFDLPAGGKDARLVIHTAAFEPGQLCPLTKSHLHDLTDTDETGLMW